jgi:putative oxidoreductase
MQFLEHLKPVSLLILRISLGIAFISHGYAKLLGNPVAWLQVMPRLFLPSYFAYILGVLELFGGGLLVLGLFTRGVGLLLAIEMGFAVARTYASGVAILAVDKYEMPLIFGAAALALATTGAGLLSIDAFTFESRQKSPKKPKA